MKNIWIHDDVRRLQETTPALQQEVISLYEWAKTCRVKRPLSPDDPALILDLRAYPHPVIQQELIWYALSQILCRDIYWENIVKYHLHYYPRFIAFLMKAFPNGLPTLRSLHDEDIARFAAQYPNDTRKKLATIFLRACRHDLCTFFDGRSPFDQDIWELNRFHLPAYRINRNSALKTFSFEGIPSEHNKVLVKRFVEYKLLHTELAKGTIYTHLQHLRAITRLLGATPLEQMTVGCVERLLPELSAQKAINEHLYTLRDFLRRASRSASGKMRRSPSLPSSGCGRTNCVPTAFLILSCNRFSKGSMRCRIRPPCSSSFSTTQECASPRRAR